MSKQAVSVALERFEGIAGTMLEEMISEVEKAQHVRIKDVEVHLIPDADGASPSVSVVVSL